MANFSNDVWMASTASGFYPHTIDQSLRFEDGDSAHLSRTPSSASNQRTFTTSHWLKRGNLGGTQPIFTAASGESAVYRITFGSYNSVDDRIQIYNYNGAYNLRFATTQVFRDTSAWYNIVVAIDTTQATNTNRMKVYVNGVQITDTIVTPTYPSENFDTYVNSAVLHKVGKGVSGNYFDGYIAEVNFIDGLQLGPDSFGEFKDGIWVPKDVSGLTYGTNGFHFDFADSSAIGNDVSGQNNDFAVSGLAATDVVLDSMTNNFAVLNNLVKGTHTFSEGNLQATSATAWNSTLATIAPTSGKWYFESVVKIKSWQMIGFEQYTIADNKHLGSTSGTKGMGFVFDPSNTRSDISYNGSNTVYNTGVYELAVGDIVSIALDLDNNNVKFYLNNSLKYDISNALESGAAYAFAFSCYGSTMIANFGQDSSFAGNKTSGSAGASDANGQGDFFYTPASSFLALCSANLPEPSIISGEDYFNTVLYDGSGGAGNAQTVGFQPSFLWMKPRNVSRDHRIIDALRGNAVLSSNDTDAEVTGGDMVINSTGFEFTSGSGNYNGSGTTYVAWNWLAGTAVSGATTGSGTAKTYTGSVNTEAGFSIIKYVGNGTSGHTIPHNLGAKPSMVLFKNRDVGDQWAVYHKDILATHNLCLNNTDAKADQDNRLNDTEPTSSVMTLGTGHVVNANDEDYIAYFFTDIDQYCKAGSYTGNGNSDGTYVSLNFRPAWVMIKAIDLDAQNWYVYDNIRDPENLTQAKLFPNTSIAENASPNSATTNTIDMFSNGFKVRTSNGGTNSSGKSYLYLAFAEQPVKYSNAR